MRRAKKLERRIRKVQEEMEIWMWDAGRRSEKERKKEGWKATERLSLSLCLSRAWCQSLQTTTPHGIQNELTEETEGRKDGRTDGRNSFSSDERLLRNLRTRERDNPENGNIRMSTRSLLYQPYIVFFLANRKIEPFRTRKRKKIGNFLITSRKLAMIPIYQHRFGVM